jgi:hypothetical protein
MFDVKNMLMNGLEDINKDYRNQMKNIEHIKNRLKEDKQRVYNWNQAKKRKYIEYRYELL